MEQISLPDARREKPESLGAALLHRRSVRRFASGILSLEEAALLLFAAQGETSPRGFRTAPSAGALYPLEIILAAGRIEGLKPGVYRYLPGRHVLTMLSDRPAHQDLAGAALGQSWMAQAQATVAVTAVYERVTRKYGSRGERYAHMEAGCASQNLALQAAVLGLGTVVVGAFDDEAVRVTLGLPQEERPLMLMPVGRA